MTVVIRGDKIAEVGKSSNVTLSKNATVIDSKGKFMIPGMWDMHGHLTYFGEGAFSLLVMNGVIGVRDMGGDLDQIDQWRQEIESGKRVGPHIVRAGPFVDGPKPNLKDRLTVTNADEAHRAVASLKARGVDFIKTHNGLSREAFFAVAEEARKQGLPLAVHLPTGLWTKCGVEGVSIAEASDAGAKTLEHIEILLESALCRKGATAKNLEEAFAENTGKKGQDIFERLRKSGTWYVPTLVAYYRGFVLWSGNPKETEGSKELHLKHLELLGAMHKAGVRILAGGHAPNLPGYFLAPTIVAGISDEARLVTEEQFGPILPVLKYRDVDDAVARANNTRMGLCASVWTQDLDRGAQVAARIEAGTVWVNYHLLSEADIPFGGFKESGLGREHGVLGLQSYMEPQVINGPIPTAA